MAVTTFGTNDSLTNKAWAKRVEREALLSTAISPLLGGPNSIIEHKKELKKSAGDRVTYQLINQLDGDGVTEGGVLEGNEEKLTRHSDSLVINQLRHGVRSKAEGTIDQQRILWDMREQGMLGLKDWIAKRYSVSFFNQVCGNTAQTDVKYTGLNPVTAPSSNRHVFSDAADAGHDSDDDLGTTDTMSLQLIDKLVELADTGGEDSNGDPLPQVKPLYINGEEKYVLYLHPYQITSIRTDTSTGQWLDIQQAAQSGGKIGDNPIYTGALGEYNRVILRKAYDVTRGVSAVDGSVVPNVRRAVLLGAQAACMAFGKGMGDTSMKWDEQYFDYDEELGISLRTTMGIKKTIYNGTDYGTIVLSTYAAKSS